MDSKSSYVKDRRIRDQLDVLRNVCFAKAILAEGTNDSTIKTTTNTVSYAIDGKLYTKAPTDNIAPTVCASQAASKRCRYLVSIDSAGNVAVTKGTEVRSCTTGALTTLSWDALQQRLCDSAEGLGSFKAGDKINVSGFTEEENNGIFTVRFVASDGSFIQVVENWMITEAAGDSVTVLVESALPDLPPKQAPFGYMIVTTGTTAFIVGTDDITTDIGTGSVTFVDVGIMPSDAWS
jgi:hypothetical protein